MNPLISVIIPVYNVEKYLSYCIDSILCQTYTNFELILVNDGSSDSSGSICDDYASRDSRIKVIHKQNGGGARGALVAGFNIAAGEYIYMIDSDDYVKPETLEILLGNIQKYDADCVQYQAIYLHSDGSEHIHTSRTFEIIEGNDRIRKEIVANYLSKAVQTPTQWSFGRTDKMYTAELIKKVTPHLDVKVTLCEDIEMSLWVALYCNKIVILEGCYLYYWRFVENSISKNMVSNTIEKHNYFLNSLQKFADENNFDDSELPDISDRIYFDLMITSLSRNIPVLKKYNYLKELKNLIHDKSNIIRNSSNHSFITKYSLRYLSHFDCFIPSLLSQIYLNLRK